MWNRREKAKLCQKYCQLIFDKGSKAIQWNKVSCTSGAKTNGHQQAKKKIINLGTDLASFPQINSSWIIDLNVKAKLQNS